MVGHLTRYLVGHLKSGIVKNPHFSGYCGCYWISHYKLGLVRLLWFFKLNSICYFQIFTPTGMLYTIWLTNQIVTMIRQKNEKCEIMWNVFELIFCFKSEKLKKRIILTIDYKYQILVESGKITLKWPLTYFVGNVWVIWNKIRMFLLLLNNLVFNSIVLIYKLSS